MEEIAEEPVALLERAAALDTGKAALTVCAWVPREIMPAARLQEVRTYVTTTRSLLGLRDWPVCQGSDPGDDGGHLCLLETAYLLEDDIAECWVSMPAMSRTPPAGPRPTN
jgi:hypothetical protein